MTNDEAGSWFLVLGAWLRGASHFGKRRTKNEESSFVIRHSLPIRDWEVLATDGSARLLLKLVIQKLHHLPDFFIVGDPPLHEAMRVEHGAVVASAKCVADFAKR